MSKLGNDSYETAVLALTNIYRSNETAKKILFVLLFGQKNCNQISSETGLICSTIQNYLDSLMEQRLIKNSSSAANTELYMLTPLGEEVISTLYTSNQKEFGITSQNGSQ